MRRIIDLLIQTIVIIIIIASPSLAEITPVSDNTTVPALTPQRGLGDLVNASTATAGNLTANLSLPDAAKIKAPFEIPKKLFWTAVVLFGGFILMGVALNRPGGFRKFRVGFLVVLGGALVFVGVFFAVV